jgi:hypothetical protein
LGGLGGGPSGSIRDVSVTSNRVDTDLAGITVIGGGPSAFEAAGDTYGHSVSGVRLRANVIARVPVLATRWDLRAKGINIIGGLGGPPPATGRWRTTTGNSVTSVTLENNSVAGAANDVNVRSNFGEGATDNVAALGLRPPMLTVAVSGRGDGLVRGDPPGIICPWGATCSHPFDDLSQVALTASRGPDSAFAAWSGGCSGTGACTLVMNADQSVTARFDLLCIVPEVRKQKLARAKSAIRTAHCRVGRVKRAYSARVKRGQVLSQKPRAGARLAEGSTVSLVVSRGKR